MASEDQGVKKYSYSYDEESFQGRFDSPEEAAREAFEQDEDREMCWVGEIADPSQPESFFNARDWLDHVSEQDDYSMECAEDWDTSNKEQRQELEKRVREVLAEWLDRHKLRPKFWLIKNAKKHTRTQEMFSMRWSAAMPGVLR